MPAPWYLLFLALVGAERLAELVVSKRHQKTMTDQGVEKVPERHYKWMVAVHAGVLVAAYLEVVLLHRPVVWAIAVPAAVAFAIATALRAWVLLTMRTH